MTLGAAGCRAQSRRLRGPGVTTVRLSVDSRPKRAVTIKVSRQADSTRNPELRLAAATAGVPGVPRRRGLPGPAGEAGGEEKRLLQW